MHPQAAADRAAGSAACRAASRPHCSDAGQTQEPVLDADARPYDSFLASFHKRGARREGPCRLKTEAPPVTHFGRHNADAPPPAGLLHHQAGSRMSTSVMPHMGPGPAAPSSCWIRSLSLTIDQRAQEHQPCKASPSPPTNVIVAASLGVLIVVPVLSLPNPTTTTVPLGATARSRTATCPT